MENLQEGKKIEVGSEMLGYLNTTRKWTMFFAILGFIFIGLMLLGGIVAGGMLKSLSGLSNVEGIEGFEETGAFLGVAEIMVFIVLLIFAVIYFIPVFYLYRFSRHTSMAVKNLDPAALTKALRNLKSYWVYLGILTIIILVVYFIIFMVAGASMAFLSGLKG